MSYTVTTTAGKTVATVADGTVNTTATSLTLIGKNYAGYGIFLNENYVTLLENFSNSTPPSAPLTGQLWYDNVNDILKVYNSASNVWKPISSSISQGTAPSASISVTGDIWWDTTNAQLKIWSGSAWITIGPTYTATSGTSGPVTQSINDTGGNPHVVTMFYVSNSIIAILSKDATFTPQTAIPGFSTIIPGMNLISQSTLSGAQFTGATTGASTLGGLSASQFLRSDIAQTTNYAFGAAGGLTVGSDLSITTSSGTAVFAESTNNKNIVFNINQSNTPTTALTLQASTNTVAVAGPLTVGSGATVTGAITGTSYLNVAGNVMSAGGIFNGLTVNGATNHSGNITPTANNVSYLGNATNRYNTIYGVNLDVLTLTTGGATTFTQVNSSGNVLAQAGTFNDMTINGITRVTGLTNYLNVTGNIMGATATFGTANVNGAINSTGLINTSGNVSASQGSFGSIVITGSMTPSANISASQNLGSASNWFGTVYSNRFQGVSVNALYADLAENYSADAAYEPGTVVQLSGEQEITICDIDLSDNVFGVVSTDPAYLMNSGLTGEYVAAVALIGRTPVRVTGQVTKGDRLVSAGNGLARAATNGEATSFNVIGRSLEDKTTLTEGIVEAIVKLNS